MTTNIKFMVVFNKLAYQFSSKLEENLASLGMPSSMYPILAHLNVVKREKTQKLGEVAAITSGSITYIVNKLEKLGLVLKEQCLEDKRITWVKITDKGSTEFNRVNQEHLHYLNQLLNQFTESEKNQFIDQMKYFGKTLEKRQF